jgi:hypothetical protein
VQHWCHTWHLTNSGPAKIQKAWYNTHKGLVTKMVNKYDFNKHIPPPANSLKCLVSGILDSMLDKFDGRIQQFLVSLLTLSQIWLSLLIKVLRELTGLLWDVSWLEIRYIYNLPARVDIHIACRTANETTHTLDTYPGHSLNICNILHWFSDAFSIDFNYLNLNMWPKLNIPTHILAPYLNNSKKFLAVFYIVFRHS